MTGFAVDYDKVAYYSAAYNKLGPVGKGARPRMDDISAPPPDRQQRERAMKAQVVRRRFGAILAFGLSWLAPAGPALAKPAVSCGGAALLGGAQLMCSQVDPKAPAQLCTFRWALATPANQTQVVSGSFLLPPGASNVEVYSAGGFSHARSPPIVLCQGRRRAP